MRSWQEWAKLVSGTNWPDVGESVHGPREYLSADISAVVADHEMARRELPASTSYSLARLYRCSRECLKMVRRAPM